MLKFQAKTELNIDIIDKTISYDNTTLREVDFIWKKAVTTKKLFNGIILSAEKIDENCIYAYPVEYKYFFAQHTNPTLYQALRIQPLAVSGILQCPQGYIFGLRHHTTQDENKWELVPSGSIDYLTRNKHSEQIQINQIITELKEEIGIHEQHLNIIKPCALIEDSETHVIDIGIYLKTLLSISEIENIFKQQNSNEYKKIDAIPLNEIASFIQKNKVIPASETLLTYLINHEY